MKNTVIILLITVLVSACSSGKKAIPTTTTSNPPVTKTAPIDQVEIEVKDSIVAIEPSDTVKEVAKKTEVVARENSEEKRDTILNKPEIFNHSVWDGLLTQFVAADGRVDYPGFNNNKGILRDYIASLGAHMPDESWTQEDQLAYWMNAYNAMTVDLILRNLPLASIKEIDKPWDQRLWKLGSKWYNLDEIEHRILRKMGDARIHFGINCASFSCPPLLNEAFTSEKVDSQLDQLARTFINDPKRNTISEKSIEISKIFSWFAKDFKTGGSLIDFLNKYSEITIDPKARKSYKDYDWNLNN